MMRRDQALRQLTCCNVRPQKMIDPRPRRRSDAKDDRGARMPEPHLVGIDPMPVRSLMRLQQEQDRRAGRSLARCRLGPPGLAIPAAFGMRGQVERPDQCGSILPVACVRRFTSNLISAETKTYAVVRGSCNLGQ